MFQDPPEVVETVEVTVKAKLTYRCKEHRESLLREVTQHTAGLRVGGAGYSREHDRFLGYEVSGLPNDTPLVKTLVITP